MKLSDLGGDLCFLYIEQAAVTHRNYCVNILCARCPFRKLKGQGWKNVDVNIGMDIELKEEESWL